MAGFFLTTYGLDLAALLLTTTLFVGYRTVQRRRARRDPGATLQSQQAATRAEWVAEILGSGNGILGVQTLRNAMMGSLFFASNTIFLVLGVLSLSAQQHLGETWALLNLNLTGSPSLTQGKLLLLLLTLLLSFFCFTSAIRLFAHASVSIGHKASRPQAVTAQIDSAWAYQALGVRCYYFAASILFWLFGPVWFVLAGVCAIAVMHRFDSAPTRNP
ncbi:MAG: DUF599 domain-containing protein [Vicinamibacterales bacterium]